MGEKFLFKWKKPGTGDITAVELSDNLSIENFDLEQIYWIEVCRISPGKWEATGEGWNIMKHTNDALEKAYQLYIREDKLRRIINP